ncbi:hypothetical protein BAE44_0002696 [Dichanthelium oligosanthes]|uniref:Pentatricopeptide repeat-containing protein n=1 Tax=Dichanthelium oligosanthes TaxID=888268 RepID=A0A1E5WFX6_9POAL|nr:hypothetical protein BAE44_0002696 [Dichanthelium oligosanthes]
MALSIASCGGHVVAWCRGGSLLVLGHALANALLCTAATTPQHISHYLAHQPRATWEALSAKFAAAVAGAAPHGHVDAVLLSLARHTHASPKPVAKNALTFFHWSIAAAASSSLPSSYYSLRSYCLLVHLLSRAALFRDASVLLEAAIAKHSPSSSPASSFLDAFFTAYEDSGTATTTRGLDLLVHAYAGLRLPGDCGAHGENQRHEAVQGSSWMRRTHQRREG